MHVRNLHYIKNKKIGRKACYPTVGFMLAPRPKSQALSQRLLPLPFGIIATREEPKLRSLGQ